jgi:hypothetical protein
MRGVRKADILDEKGKGPSMHPPLRVPSEEIQRRIGKLQSEMDALGTDAVLIDHRIDLLYFSGCAQNGYLYVPREGGAVLLVRKHAPRAALDSPITLQAGLASIREIPEGLAAFGLTTPEVLGMAWDALPVREFELFRRLLPSRVHLDVSDTIHRIRAGKSAWEVERMAEAARVCEKTLEGLRAHVRPGMSETHLAGLSEAFSRQLGHGGGIRVRQPWHDDRSGWIDGNDAAVPDATPFSCGFRAVVNGYHAAGCRVFEGRSCSRRDRLAVRALGDAHARILSRAASGTCPGDVERAARTEGCGWSIHGTGLEAREPLDASFSASVRGQSVCLVLETRMETPSGRSLRLQDTLVAGREGVRRLHPPFPRKMENTPWRRGRS